MLIYMIIILELAFLYMAFWYVYLREPKPRKLVGNPWGNYAESNYGRVVTKLGVDPTLPVMIDKRPGSRRWQVLGGQTIGNVPTFAAANIESDITQAIKSQLNKQQQKLAVQFIENLKSSVNSLSVKLP